MRNGMKWVGGGIVAVAFLALFGAAALPASVPVAQPVAPKSDRLVMMCLPDDDICMGPMTRQEANTYVDAGPEIYRFGTKSYNEALAEVQSALEISEASPGFQITPATNQDLMKRASTFSGADLEPPPPMLASAIGN